MAEKGGKSQQAKNVVCNAKKLGNQFTLGFNSTHGLFSRIYTKDTILQFVGGGRVFRHGKHFKHIYLAIAREKNSLMLL